MKKNNIEIPKQPKGWGAGAVWMATYHTAKFCLVTVILTVCIIALSVKYSGKNIEIEPKNIMEKSHER